ncbi:MAG: phosphatidate cytidylyltransferase, partial [Hydrogenophaga sp.]|nr:phosphatidate cytidylyltransferase [Hydrogenophaga sp.]
MGAFLRGLSQNQQVGLLFLVVFGLLTLVTVAGVLLSLRERRAHGDDEVRTQRRHDNAALLRMSWVMAMVFWVGWVLGEGVSIALFGV